MTFRNKLFVTVAAFVLATSPVFAGAGGNGGGHGNSGSDGGGNSAGAGSQGHGAATSAAAQDPSTSGLTKALSVVATTQAAPQATLSTQAALDAFLAKTTSTTTTGTSTSTPSTSD